MPEPDAHYRPAKVPTRFNADQRRGSSGLYCWPQRMGLPARRPVGTEADDGTRERQTRPRPPSIVCREYRPGGFPRDRRLLSHPRTTSASARLAALPDPPPVSVDAHLHSWRTWRPRRSEEHTSELQSLMRISYAVFCWKKKKT